MNRFALVGKKLGHSYSKKYFEEKFIAEHISDSSYDLIELDDVSKLHTWMRDTENLRGFNITIPYKESCVTYLHELVDTAAVLGVVNCVVNANGKWVGHNTDVYGFSQAIKPFLKNTHQKALLLGTGGAAKAAKHVLSNLGIDCFMVSRTKNCNEHRTFNYNELTAEVVNHFKLLVNCTPVGTYPNITECPTLPYDAIGADHFLFDMVYNPEETVFLKRGKEQGALIQNGLSMLRLQAEKSWEIWQSAAKK